VSAWYLLAQVEQRAGDDQAAEDAARRIGTIDPSDARGPLALAVVRDARGDTKGVVAALEARVAKPADADLTSGAYVQMARTLASALIDLKKNKQAIRVMQDARRRLPDDHEVLFGLAATCEQAHQYDQAERAFRELIAADPSHAPALNYLGYMLAERGRKLDEAVSLIQRALAIDADNPSYLDSLGWAYYKLKRFDEALDPLGRAAAAVPDSSVIQSHLGDLYLELGRYRDAAAAFDRALSGDRDEVDAKALTKKRDRARSLQGTR
jgi:tetratricopeptide (TPR) repeat protein